jgi:hypothetical protein
MVIPVHDKDVASMKQNMNFDFQPLAMFIFSSHKNGQIVHHLNISRMQAHIKQKDIDMKSKTDCLYRYAEASMELHKKGKEL